MKNDPKASPFAALAALREKLPEGVRPEPPAPPKPPTNPAFAEKVVVARSKKGRGGKVVTTIAGVSAAAREALAHDLRKALGCGASVEEELILVQGDQTARVKAFLEGRGAKKVIIGS